MTGKQYRASKRTGFAKGSGCFTCCECGKLTRDTTRENGTVRMCALCAMKAGYRNTLSDRGLDAWMEKLMACATVAECDAVVTQALMSK